MLYEVSVEQCPCEHNLRTFMFVAKDNNRKNSKKDTKIIAGE